MMKKSNLDEMQEQKLLTIERNGFWLAFWGLFAAVAVQVLLGTPLGQVTGELLVLFGISCYLMYGCLRDGIWDRRLKPDRKTNLLVSLCAALFIAVFTYGSLSTRTEDPGVIWAFTAGLSAGVFALCFGLLTLFARMYQKRRRELDAE